jgi:glyoxylate/hydroxypyruvate reductase A
MTLLLNSFPARAEVWKRVFDEAGEPILLDQAPDPAEVTVLACWQPPKDLSVYPNLRAVLSVGAGVDQMPELSQHLMLCRSEAPGIEALVRDWVLMATLMVHRDVPAYLEHATRGDWKGLPVTMPRNRRVGILGMGRIGKLVASSLTTLGFPVVGWSRSGTPVEGVEVFAQDGLKTVLAQSDILICLLPLTQQTKGILNTQSLELLPKGARLVHAGRGAQLDMEALRAALEVGQIGCAVLDVTNPAP